MKIRTLFLLCFLSHLLHSACNVRLLSSFGYKSLIEPNKKNSLCPGIKENCCTIHDQLQLHKWYQTFYKQELINNYSVIPAQIIEISKVVDQASNIKWDQVIQSYNNNKLPTNKVFEAHIQSLVTLVTTLSPDFKTQTPENKIKAFTAFFDQIKTMRISFPCMLCDHYVHQ